MLTTQRAIRAQFWADHPTLSRRPAPAGSRRGRLHRRPTQNDYPADTRMAFCFYVDALTRAGEISEELAQRATL